MGWGPLHLTTPAPKTLFWAKKKGIFWPFWGKKCGFLVMVAPKHSITCSNTLQKTFPLESSILKIGRGAIHQSTQAPKTLFLATNWHFWAIFGLKMRFFSCWWLGNTS